MSRVNENLHHSIASINFKIASLLVSKKIKVESTSRPLSPTTREKTNTQILVLSQANDLFSSLLNVQHTCASIFGAPITPRLISVLYTEMFFSFVIIMLFVISYREEVQQMFTASFTAVVTNSTKGRREGHDRNIEWGAVTGT